MQDTYNLTETNKKLLSQVLLRGMNGSYYECGEMPAGKDIAGFVEMKSSVISKTRIKEIAIYYGLLSNDLLEIISDERECEEWLGRRAYPFDDPW